MSYPNPDGALEAAASSLERSMAELGTRIDGLTGYGKRNRHLIVWLGISLLLDVVLSGVVALVAVQARDASDRASEASSAASLNRQTQIATCESGNEARAAQIKLWGTVLDLNEKINAQTPERVEASKQFRAYVATVFAPRDCQALAAGPGK